MDKIANKYQRWYNQLIERARTRTIVGYVEKHHIIPKCLGGTNDVANIVKLTAREHYIGHLLLIKTVEGKDKMKLSYAAWLLANSNRVKSNSRLYESLKLLQAKATSCREVHPRGFLGRHHTEEAKNRIRLANKNYKHSTESKEKIRKAKIGRPRSAEVKAKIKATYALKRRASL